MKMAAPCFPSISGVVMRSVELFSGCGGLAMGLSGAGFEHQLLVERDADAVATVNHNRLLGIEHVAHWPLASGDVREVDWSPFRGKIDLVAGGPPCQPFAIGGKHAGHEDLRDMWPEAVRSIREVRPKAFLFENVRNLAGPKFRDYLDWVVESLSRPGEIRKPKESHSAHLRRMQGLKKSRDYRVSWQVVCAADFGAPQIRYRVLIIGVDASLGIEPALMRPTHSRDRLLWDQYVTGDYFRRHKLKAHKNPVSRQDKARVAKLRSSVVAPPGQPWVTVRDALSGLGVPTGKGNHIFQSGAKSYPGHTGSPLDLPSKALKAGDHGVPGGENMAILDNGAVRYFSTREAARLVGMPDQYVFPRSWTESMRQLGNAVPAQLGEAVGRWIASLLVDETAERRAA
jgi:DNA (cytosine-5)-methyltransferase 1